MSRFLMSVALLGIGLTTGSHAATQDQGMSTTTAEAPAAKDPQRQMARLSRLLGLTPQQAATLAPILAQRAQQLDALRSDASLDRRVRRDRLRSIQRDTDEKVQAVLSDTQRQKYAQWKQESRERRQQKRQQPDDAD